MTEWNSVVKKWRPKGSKNRNKKVYTFSFDWALKGMKPWQTLYTKKLDREVTARVVSLWLVWTFKTERVLMIHKKTNETEEGVLITKI